MSDIRYNLLNDNFVIIAPERLHRPLNITKLDEKYTQSDCPFCDGNENKTTPEIDAIRDENSKPNSSNWKTRVVPNLYKAVSIENENYVKHNGMFTANEGFGAHEIIIDTPHHNNLMHKWNIEEYTNWIDTIQRRIKDLKTDQRLLHISIFKNQGAKAGGTQAHPHTQIIALPIVPTKLHHKFERFLNHYNFTNRVLMEDIIVQEYDDEVRIIKDNKDFVAFCPYASEYPFEVIIASKEGLSKLEDISDSERENLVKLLKYVNASLNYTVGDIDFNVSITTPPLHHTTQTSPYFDKIDNISRLAIHIMPRIYQHGGFEISMDMMINPVTPEEASRQLRLYKDAE
ncbi:Galactose-1-phosphate uridylyltransferase [hydrothermal vent metagenome]|uniref:Galactose-1-phosphate uridylyltransferase n=1 Tax=hydrothermal vent metagenome TaxID=652676 RepID=A0A1W1BZ31_9ZZZZ